MEKEARLQVRITLMEHLLVEANGTRIEERRFPGRQGRLLFAYLVTHEGRAIPRDELAGSSGATSSRRRGRRRSEC